MANIYGDYRVLGDLYIEAPNQQPYPLLLSTNNDGKIIFVDAVISVTASSPINVVNTSGTVSISHNSSGWVDKLSLDGSDIISNLEVSQEGHIINWETRQLTPQDIGADNRYVRYDVNTQGLNSTQQLNARTNIQSLSKDTDDFRTGKLSHTGDIDLISSDLNISTNKKIDTIELNGVINIGTGNSQVINIGKSGSTVNIIGDLLYQNVTNLEVSDKLIRINKGGSISSANNSGFEIEENGVVTGYFKTNSLRDGWYIKAPSKTAYFNLAFDLLNTTNRTQKIQDQDGIIALVGVGDIDNRYESSLSKGNIIQGNAVSISGTLINRLVNLGDITISHANTSTQSSVSNINGNVIQSITLDTNFGHITNISSINLDARYNNYTHPTGFNNQPSINLTGASVISQISVSNEGHVTGVNTRNITLSDLSYSIPNLQSVTNVGSTTTTTITAANFITTSDIRIKTEITPIENALDVLDKFTSYEYLKNGSKEAGFIAQEVKEVIPYTVFENDGILTMSDRPILAYLHSAVLELKSEIDKIKSKL